MLIESTCQTDEEKRLFIAWVARVRRDNNSRGTRRRSSNPRKQPFAKGKWMMRKSDHIARLRNREMIDEYCRDDGHSW